MEKVRKQHKSRNLSSLISVSQLTMGYGAVASFLRLLPLIYQSQQPAELQLISKLNDFFNFDHNIFILLHSTTDGGRFFNTNGSIGRTTPQSVFVIEGENGDVIGLENVQSKNSLVIVVPGCNTPDWLGRVNAIQNRIKQQYHRAQMKIGVFTRTNTSKEELLALFSRSWELGIINIFAATYTVKDPKKLKIFTYNPFETFEIVDVTGAKSLGEIFLRRSDFQNHKFRMGGRQYNIMDFEFVNIILERVNATFVSHKPPTILPIDFECELSYMSTERAFMYPMKMDYEVVVVPKSLPYDSFSAYLQNITSKEFFGLSLAALVVVVAALTAVRFNKQQKFLLAETLADVINLLMNDNSFVDYRQMARAEVCIIVPLTFVGFIFVNKILSNLQGFLMQPLLQPQIHSIEEIYRSDLHILVPDSIEKDQVINVLESLSPRGDWSDKVREIALLELGLTVYAYNSSISFLWSLSAILALENTQQLLNVRGYHITNVNMGIRNLAFVVNETFPFRERFNDIASRAKSAGLYQYWMNRETYMYHTLLLGENERLRSKTELDVEPISFPIFIVYAWLASVVVLFVEIFWDRFKLSLSTFIKNRKCNEKGAISIRWLKERIRVTKEKEDLKTHAIG